MRSVLLWACALAACGEAHTADAGSPPEPPPGFIASPDGTGYCCVPDEPTCDCGKVGGYVTEALLDDPLACGRYCDYVPLSWGPQLTDDHGCVYYEPTSGMSCIATFDAGGP